MFNNNDKITQKCTDVKKSAPQYLSSLPALAISAGLLFGQDFMHQPGHLIYIDRFVQQMLNAAVF